MKPTLDEAIEAINTSPRNWDGREAELDVIHEVLLAEITRLRTDNDELCKAVEELTRVVIPARVPFV